MKNNNFSFKADLHYGELLADQWVYRRLTTTLNMISIHAKKSNHNKIRVLDFGGYQGNLKKIHDMMGLNLISDYTIIDGDKSAIEKAHAEGMNAIYCDLNLYRCELPGEYDCVVATEVLEHLLDPRSILTELSNAAGNSGFVAISLPNENTIIHRIYSLMGMGPDSEAFNLYKHLHLPTLKQATDFLQSQLNIVTHQNWFHFGGNGAKFSALSFQPGGFMGSLLVKLGQIFPSLLARGRIYICTRKPE